MSDTVIFSGPVCWVRRDRGAMLVRCQTVTVLGMSVVAILVEVQRRGATRHSDEDQSE